MMNCCCIPSCPKPANLICYDIPTDVIRRRKWLNSINSGQHDFPITDKDGQSYPMSISSLSMTICSLHFKQSDYIYFVCDDQSSKRKLSEDAVPSIYPWTFDWESNYRAEMESVEINGKSPQQFSSSVVTVANTGLPEGEAVQLGNVESLGINTQISTEDDTCQENSLVPNSSNSLPDKENLKSFLLTTSILSASFSHVMQLSTSTSKTNSRVETSDEDVKVFNLLSKKIHYSCSECKFKSSDIISLKNHRMKSHPNQSLPGSSNNTTVDSSLGLSHCETPSKKILDSPDLSPQSGSVRYRDQFGKFRYVYSCEQCSFTTTTNIHLRKHTSKHHSTSDMSNTDYNSESNPPSPSSASCSPSNSLIASKRPVKKWYFCPTCSFQTPNARKLKAHVKTCISDTPNSSDNQAAKPTTSLGSESKSKSYVKACHSDTPNSSDNQVIKPTTSLQNQPKNTDLEVHIERSDLKKLHLLGKLYYLCPGSNCSTRAKDPAYILRHYRKNHTTSKSPKPNELDSPNQKRSKHLKEKEELSMNGSLTKVANESTNEVHSKRFFCKLCKFSTSKKYDLKPHEEKHVYKGRFQCKMCSYSVDRNRSLAFHEANHHQDVFPCSHCDFKADTWISKRKHQANVHKAANTSLVQSVILSSGEHPSDLDHDLEHACSHCSFITPSRERFVAHEKTHVPDTVESSTEELSIENNSVAIKKETSTPKLKRKHDELEKGCSSSSGKMKMIERLVYQCPLCNYWARTLKIFHQHLIAHEKTPAFKCSECDFSARYRRNVTRHIYNNSKESHRTACWIMIKKIPENQYPQYLKTALVPECSYSGKSLTPSNSPTRKPLNIRDSSSRTSSESFTESNSDEDSREWIPSSSISSEISKGNTSKGSSLSFVITPRTSPENEKNTSSVSSSPTSESNSEHSMNDAPSTSKSSSSFTGGRVLRSSVKIDTPRRKRLRIESDEETEQLPRNEVKALTPSSASPLKNTEPEKGTENIFDQKLKLKFKKISSNFPRDSFRDLEDALAKRQQDEKKFSEMQHEIKKMQSIQDEMKGTDPLSQSELLKLKERKTIVNKQIMKLNGQKIEAELHVRTQQCQELKLSLSMYDPDQQEDSNAEELAEIKKLVAELELKLGVITNDIKNFQEEIQDLDRQIKDAEESHAGAAQLFDILQSELSEKKFKLNSFQEELAESDARITELVNKEKKEIKALTDACEEELKKAYMRGLSKIRDRERELLNALEQIVREKSVSPNIDEN